MRKLKNRIIRRGEIYHSNLGSGSGSIQSGDRPVVIISNNINNKFSPTLNVLPITSRSKSNIPVHVSVGTTEGLPQQSTILTEQITTINKTQLQDYMGMCNNYKMIEIERALAMQLGVDITDHTDLHAG